MKCDKKHMRLYAVTDRAWLHGRRLYDDVEKALRGGVTMLQLREKELGDDEFLSEALELKELCGRYGVPFIINDNVELAGKCGADGIHVGQSDMCASDVRRAVGSGMIVGVSAQTVEQALLAEKNGADYLGVGSVFTTSTKLDAEHVSYDTLKDICRAVSIPVCAIGGISGSNMDMLAGSGIDGVALVSAIFASDDIESECSRLKRLSDTLFSK